MRVQNITNETTMPVEPPNEEKIKSTLQNENTSPQQAAAAMTELSNLYSQKEQRGTATDDEKAMIKLMNDALTGEISSTDSEQLASKLGMNIDKLREMVNFMSPEK